MAKLGLWSRDTVRELTLFLVVGGVQYALDVSLFSLLALTTGLTVASNVVSRAAGAVCGYYLNGVLTFRTLGRRRGGFGLRFALAWVLMTIASTLLVRPVALVAQRTAQPELLIAGKAGVELLLFIVSFLLCKLWIFVPRRAATTAPAQTCAAQHPTLFVMAHADDEFFFAPLIKRLVEADRPVHCIYTTDSAGYGVDPQVRRRESTRALGRVGVPESHLHFVGIQLGVRDGTGHLHLSEIYAAAERIARDVRPDEFYVLAWEGGHADHDASHLVGVALARHLGVEHAYECPGYHAHARVLPFRVMTWIPRAVAARELRLRLAEGLFCFALLGCYASQWRTWLGIAPEAFLHLVLRRRHEHRPVAGIDYTHPPHAGPLLYEKRFGVPWAEFQGATQEFIAAHLAPSAQCELTAAGA